MRKKLNYLKKIKNLSFFFSNKNNSWNNWALFLYDPFFLLFFTYFIRKGNRKKAFYLIGEVLYLTKEITRLSPIFVFKKAIYNSQVLLETVPVLEKKRRGKKLKVIFYKSKMYNKKKRTLKGIDLLMNHVKMIPTNELYLYEKVTISILNAFFKQGPVYHKLTEMYDCIGNINKKKKFYKQKNKILHYDFNKKKNRRMRNIKKRIRYRDRNKKLYKKKKYSIYRMSYQLN